MLLLSRGTRAVAVGTVVLFAIAGILYVQRAPRGHLADIHQTLRLVAENNRQVVEGWRTERLADATVLVEGPTFQELLKRFHNGNSLAHHPLMIRFQHLCRHSNDLIGVLVDRHGAPLLALHPTAKDDPPDWRQNSIRHRDDGTPGFADLHNLLSGTRMLTSAECMTFRPTPA